MFSFSLSIHSFRFRDCALPRGIVSNQLAQRISETCSAMPHIKELVEDFGKDFQTSQCLRSIPHQELLNGFGNLEFSDSATCFKQTYCRNVSSESSHFQLLSGDQGQNWLRSIKAFNIDKRKKTEAILSAMLAMGL